MSSETVCTRCVRITGERSRVIDNGYDMNEQNEM